MKCVQPCQVLQVVARKLPPLTCTYADFHASALSMHMHVLYVSRDYLP